MQASTNRNQMIKIFINEITLALVKQMPNQDSHRVHYDQLKASLEKDGQPQSVHELIANISQMEAGTTFFIWGKEPKRILKFISDNLINISAAGGLVQNPSGEVLFIKRKGKWDLPKGKPEKKEDNRTTAMTGGQATAASGNYTSADDMCVDIKSLIKAMGHENVQEVDQFDYEATKKVLTEETNKPGISFIIAKRPCALKFKIQENTFYVNPNVCIGCRNCVKTNCPPIRMKKYHNIDKLKSSIDPDMCAGCSVCAQVCPVDAIQPRGQHPDHSKKGSAKYKRQEYQKMKLNNEDQE